MLQMISTGVDPCFVADGPCPFVPGGIGGPTIAGPAVSIDDTGSYKKNEKSNTLV